MIHEVDEYFSCSCIRRATSIINEASFVLFVMSCDVWPRDTDQVPVYTALLPNHVEARQLQLQEQSISVFLYLSMYIEIC